MHPTKQELRQTLKHRRFAIPPEERELMSARICSNLLKILNGCSPVLVYASKQPEVNTGMLITALIAQGGRVIVPIIERETVSLRLSYLDDPTVLVESTFHVPEPIGSEIPARPEEVSVAVIPVLGFDRQGNRLGYGAGYYDRFLEKNPNITRIGLAFACQETPVIPCDSNDVKIDIIVTENGVCRCGGDSG
jgi:5-formyltetrahydrofolate cyclo-ligase